MNRGKPLKRTAPLKRGEGPKADPQKVADWQRRSRQPLDRSTGRPKGREAPPKQAGSVRARVAAVKFTQPRSATEVPCVPCGLAGISRRAAHWHHWLAQSELRKRARGLARDLPVAELLAEHKARIDDPRNLTPMCFDCHMGHEDHPERWAAYMVPASAWEFAAELGGEWLARLRRAYPETRRTVVEHPEGNPDAARGQARAGQHPDDAR